jgi:alcohol dehydrogenase (cytochrome c)
MPPNAPGSLSQQDYLAVSAYIMSKNSYSAGSKALSTSTAGSVKLANVALNENGSPANSSGQADEIVRAAPPTTQAFGPMPAGANVNISDEMLAGADSDAKNWLLGGKNYSNHRYSALDQITAQNVGTLTPVALVQTG